MRHEVSARVVNKKARTLVQPRVDYLAAKRLTQTERKGFENKEIKTRRVGS